MRLESDGDRDLISFSHCDFASFFLLLLYLHARVCSKDQSPMTGTCLEFQIDCQWLCSTSFKLKPRGETTWWSQMFSKQTRCTQRGMLKQHSLFFRPDDNKNHWLTSLDLTITQRALRMVRLQKKHISRTMTVSSSESDVVERKKAIWNNRCMYIHIFRCALMQQLASLHSATNGCVYLFRKKNCWLVLRWLKASLAECCRIPKVSIGIVDTQVYYCSRSFKYICTRRSKFQPDAVVGPYSAWRIKLFL